MPSRAFLLGLLFLAETALRGAEAPEFQDVFTPGQGGFPSLRIPALIATPQGTLLAFAEGRARPADHATNRIVLRRSADRGRTWSPLQVIADDSTRSLNNPCAVVERQSGRVYLMFQSYPHGVAERSPEIVPGVQGEYIVRNYLMHSDDDGVTWSPFRDVTPSTKRAERVTTVASGPGVGIQLRHGPHAGRLLIPFNEGPWGLWNVFGVYSDDRGATWRLGDIVPGGIATDSQGRVGSQVNEVQFVELSDGSVRLNARRWGSPSLRKTSVSRDGGQTWSPIENVPELPDPSCMASICRYSDPADGAPSRLLWSGPGSTRRESGTVAVSYDDGVSWPVRRVLWPGSFAYSVLAPLDDGTIGCLFEADDTKRIVFARFTLDWLTGARTRLASTATDRIKAFCVDFNWGPGGPPGNGFAGPGVYANANAEQHYRWYRELGVNTIQTFCVSCIGYAWYRSEIAPVQPGMKGDFLKEVTSLAHRDGLRVMGYFCVGANTWWAQQHPDQSYGAPSAIHLPLTRAYLDYLASCVQEALRHTDIDGFMLDWLFSPPLLMPETRMRWLECERAMYGELFGEPFPGVASIDAAKELEFQRRAVERCWDRLRQAAKSVKPDALLWLSCFDLAHPQVAGSRLLKEVDWIMNETPTPEKLDAVTQAVGPHTRLIQCLVGGSSEYDASRVINDPKYRNAGLYGFAPWPDLATTLPPVAPKDAQAKTILSNIEKVRRAFHAESKSQTP